LSIFAVENSARSSKRALRGRNGSRFISKKETTMRVFESAAVGLVALVAQMLVVATVLI
jgi:hypothetical protein